MGVCPVGLRPFRGMGQNFLSCDREQVMLLPASVADWVPAGHLARFVIEVVGQLDLGGIYGYYRADGRGRPAHDPAMMVQLLLYNYAVGVRSSRAIERRCVEDVACRMIAANRAPDHATIARFRERHEQGLSDLFLQLLALCQDAGMVRVGTVAVDSTKLAADASMGRNLSYDGLRAQAQRILGEAAEIDAREDELFGERRGDELPDDLADPATRPERIRELLERAEQRKRQIEAEREEQIAERAASRKHSGGPRTTPGLRKRELDRLRSSKFNLTDPDSGVVRHRGMLMQGYNIQAVVGEGQVILATAVSGVSPDGGQLAPALERAQENLARAGIEGAITEVLADSGYWQTKQITRLRDSGLNVLVPPLIRARSVDRTNPEVQAMRARLDSEEGRERYKRRQQIVEPVFAHIKYIRGITRVLRRGKPAVQAEIDLIATTHNLLKLHRHTTPAAA
jgi:transposase